MKPRNRVVAALVKNPNRSARRHESERAKQRARRTGVIRGWNDMTARQVGIQANQHNTCGCDMCTMQDPDERYNERDLMLLQYE